MILDRLANWKQYRGLDPNWDLALQYLCDTDLLTLKLGRHDLDGNRLFVLVQDYLTKPDEQGRWEAHQRYCDIQYVARGTERVGVANLENMRIEEPYDAERDVAFFSGAGDFITLPEGSFAIFAPQDVHMPSLVCGTSGPVRKIVVKAAVGAS